MKIVTTLLLIIALCYCAIASAHVDKLFGDKLYIDDEEFSPKTDDDAFHIHVGNNVWLVTHSVHRDAQGLFSYECNLKRSLQGNGLQIAYEKKWKCPYCYMYWPVGKPCSNLSCPSNYK